MQKNIYVVQSFITKGFNIIVNSLQSQMPVVFIDNSTPNDLYKAKNVKIINLKLRINKEIVTAKVAVKDCPATLADIVPMVRMLSVKINQAVYRHAIYNKISIPCRQGCSNCCYLLIILSVPEALRLAEELLLMPQNKYEKLRRYLDGISNYVREQLPQNLLSDDLNYIDYSNLTAVSNWYTEQRKPCTFLQNGICTIYEQRPLVCRDFMVIGSLSQCQLGKVSVKTAVKISPSILSVLRQLASEFEHKSQRIVLLHDLLTWYEENIALYNQKWPAPTIVERFIDILMYNQQSKSSDFTYHIYQQRSTVPKRIHLKPVSS